MATVEKTTRDVAVSGNVLGNDSDLHAGAPGEDNTPLTAKLVSSPARAAAFTLNADGSFDILLCRKGQFGNHTARRRVRNCKSLGGRGFAGLTIDEVLAGRRHDKFHFK